MEYYIRIVTVLLIVAYDIIRYYNHALTLNNFGLQHVKITMGWIVNVSTN